MNQQEQHALAEQLRACGWVVEAPPRRSLTTEVVKALLVEGSQPSSPGTKGLLPCPRMTDAVPLSNNVYKDARTGDCWVELGWITHPATHLHNLRTGERHVEIIGCLNADRFEMIGRIDPHHYLWI